MPLIKTPFKRKSNERDSRLFVIACEGSKTEPRYFEALKTYFQNSRLNIEILNRTDYGINENNSSAKDVIKTLDGFKKRYSFDKNDELWLVLDRDAANFSEKSLNEIARLAVQKQYFLAVSNPTFELWLVLHFENPNDFTVETTQNYLENKKISTEKRHLETVLANHLSGYKKANFDTKPFMENINIAIENAKQLPLQENERWHNGLGTSVYILVEKLIQK